jgi:hypothetical protein
MIKYPHPNSPPKRITLELEPTIIHSCIGFFYCCIGSHFGESPAASGSSPCIGVPLPTGVGNDGRSRCSPRRGPPLLAGGGVLGREDRAGERRETAVLNAATRGRLRDK